MNDLRTPLIMSQTVDVTEMLNSEFQSMKQVLIDSENEMAYKPIPTIPYQTVEDSLGPVYGTRALSAEASFLRRRDREKNSVVLVFEMDAKDGFQPIRSITLRSLLYEVLNEVEPHLPRSSQSLSNLDIEKSVATADKPSGDKPSADHDTLSNSSNDVPADLLGMPEEGLLPNPSVLQNRTSLNLGSRGRNAPAPPMSKQSSLASQRSLGVDHRSHSHIHGVCHDEVNGWKNPSATALDMMSSVALGLRLRDLRRLDFSINPNEQLDVQVRRHVVLFSIDTLRCIVTANKVRVIVPSGADTFVRYLEDYIGGWHILEKEKHEHRMEGHLSLRRTPHHHHSASAYDNGHGTLAFEVFIYESLLAIVKEIITAEVLPLRAQVRKITDYFTNGTNVSPLAQDKIRYLKDRITRISAKLRRYHDSLDDIMADDETMALMNLTSLAHKPSLYAYPLSHEIMVQHEEVEEALESYLADFSTLESDLDQMKRSLDNTEVQASLRLDMARNKVLVANIMLTIVSANITFGAYITGIFGMNLDNTITIQPINGVFEVVFMGTFVLMIVASIFVYYYFVYQGVIVEDDPETEKMFLT